MAKVDTTFVKDLIIPTITLENLANDLEIRVQNQSIVVGDEIGNRNLGEGHHIVTIGLNAGDSITRSHSVYIGVNAGVNHNDNKCVIIGHEAGKDFNAEDCVIIGSRAYKNSSDTTGDNVILGYQTSINASIKSGVSLGTHCARGVDANRSDFVGYNAGPNESENHYASFDVVVGSGAGTSIGASTQNDYSFDDDEPEGHNTIIGYQGATSLSSGLKNTIIGTSITQSLTTGNRNVIFGNPTSGDLSTGRTLTTGSDNILVGIGVDVPSGSTNGYIAIGNRNITTNDIITCQMEADHDDSLTTVNGNIIPTEIRVRNVTHSTPVNGDVYFNNITNTLFLRSEGEWISTTSD